MTLAQLRYTIAIAKAGSMNEAAKSLYISQPSLPRQSGSWKQKPVLRSSEERTGESP